MTDQPNNPYAAPQPPDENCPTWGAASAPTEYRYRKFVRWMQYLIPALMGIMVLMLGGALVLLASSVPFARSPEIYWALGGISLFLLAEGAVGSWVYYRLAGVTVVLEDNALVYRSRGDEKRLPFDEAMSLDAGNLTYVGGWLRIRSRDCTVRVTVVLEGIGHLVRSLKAALDVRGLTEGYDRDRLFRFLKTAEFADQSWQRSEAIFLRLMLLTIAGGSLGAIVARMQGGQLIAAILWISASALWPLIVYLGTEAVFVKRFMRGPNKEAFTCPPRDPAAERRVYQRAIAGGFALYVVVAAAVLHFA